MGGNVQTPIQKTFFVFKKPAEVGHTQFSRSTFERASQGWEQHATGPLLNNLGANIAVLEKEPLSIQQRANLILQVEDGFRKLQSRSAVDEVLESFLTFLRARFQVHQGNMFYVYGTGLRIVVADKAPRLEDFSEQSLFSVPAVYKVRNDIYIIGYEAAGELQITLLDESHGDFSTHIHQTLYCGLKFPDDMSTLQLGYVPQEMREKMEEKSVCCPIVAIDNCYKWLGARMATEGYQGLVKFFTKAEEKPELYAPYFQVTVDKLQAICKLESETQKKQYHRAQNALDDLSSTVLWDERHPDEQKPFRTPS